jgi:hypothetical protein
MNWKGFGRKQYWLNQRTVPIFVWKERGKPLNASIRIVGVLDENQTDDSRLWTCELQQGTSHCIVLWYIAKAAV